MEIYPSLITKAGTTVTKRLFCCNDVKEDIVATFYEDNAPYFFTN